MKSEEWKVKSEERKVMSEKWGRKAEGQKGKKELCSNLGFERALESLNVPHVAMGLTS